MAQAYPSHETSLYHLTLYYKTDPYRHLILHPTELRVEVPPKIHLAVPGRLCQSARTGALAEGSSVAVLEVSTTWTDTTTHPSTFGEVARRGWTGDIFVVPVCTRGNSVYTQVVYPLKASCGNWQPDSLADDNKTRTGQIGLKGTALCTAQFGAVCGAIPHWKGMKKLKK